jgi:hypothetical protein
VLRPKDLPTGNMGQAMTPGSKPGSPAAPAAAAQRVAPASPYPGAGGSNNGSPTPYQSRSWRPNPATSDGIQPGAVVTAPSGGIYYQPGTASTGQLGSQLMPEQNG